MRDDELDDSRRGFLKCMAWAGTGALFAFDGGGLTQTELHAKLARLAERRAHLRGNEGTPRLSPRYAI